MLLDIRCGQVSLEIVVLRTWRSSSHSARVTIEPSEVVVTLWKVVGGAHGGCRHYCTWH